MMTEKWRTYDLTQSLNNSKSLIFPTPTRFRLCTRQDMKKVCMKITKCYHS